MATGFVLTGSVLGFLTANVMFWTFDVALMMAIAVWILAGPASAALYVLTHRPGGEAAPHGERSLARTA
jgi:uncharacterized membrane protein